MSNGGNMLDSIRGLFSSGGGGRDRRRRRQRDPVRERLERVEQIVSGVEMAADALDEQLKGLRREAKEAAAGVLEAARSLARAGERDGGEGTGPGEGSDVAGELSRCVDALEELHYRLLRIEVHPEVQSEEEREQAAGRARESVQRVREVADSVSGSRVA